jgi:uncharacterized protein YukJ
MDLGSLLKIGALKGDGSGVTHLDLASDSESNVVYLTMADVLNLPATNGIHQLMLTGAANDKLMLAEGEWTDSGQVISQQGHDYAVYTGAHNASAQLLIDQQMLSNT